MSKRGENIYQRKDGLWEARYVKAIDITGKKKYGSVYARTYSEVKAKRQDILDDMLLQRKNTSLRRITVSELVCEWLHINRCRIKSSTYQRYLGLWNKHIKAELGTLPVIYLTPVTIQDFARGRINEGLSPRSVNSVLVFLHSCLKYGARQYRLPMPEFRYFPINEREMRVFSQEEQQRIVEYLKKDMDIYKYGVLLALYTGVRIGELCALRWSDVEDDCIKINQTMQRLHKEIGDGTELYIGTPKTPSSVRTIPLLSSLRELTASLKVENSGQTYVLGTGALPVVESRVMQNKFHAYLRELGIENATFHTLRHTFATRAVEASMDIKTLTELLGHANVQTTLNRYVHSSMEQKRLSVEKLNLFF